VTVLVAVLVALVVALLSTVVVAVLTSVDVADDATEDERVEVWVEVCEEMSQLWKVPPPYKSSASLRSSIASHDGTSMAPFWNAQPTSYDVPGNLVTSSITPSIAAAVSVHGNDEEANPR
jgi:hypothetical protein